LHYPTRRRTPPGRRRGRRGAGGAIAGRKIEIAERAYDPLKVTDLMQINWTELYTQDHVAALRRKKTPRRGRGVARVLSLARRAATPTLAAGAGLAWRP